MPADQLRVLRLVIASPGDVKAEREIIPRVVDEVNRNIARPRGLHLEVYRWETDSHPGFHPQGPQGLIDPKLKIEDCDILIGIFWRRFGTAVSDAKSGTEHEFRIAYEAWKKNSKPQIMVYFSQKAYSPKSKEETDQWGLVLQFKEDFPREGLWWDYKNKNEFEQLTRNHLTQFLNEQSPLDKPSPEPVVLSARFQLPPPPADFTGRESELHELRAAIEKGGVHISGLQGQGGVGKTVLALKLAESLAPHFPDAQIYTDLRGVSDKPLTPGEAMAHVIRAFHAGAKLPEKEEDLGMIYRSTLHGKQVLLLMDNARDAAQVKLLIPPAGCILLVTSRLHFTLPGLHSKHLDTLAPPDANGLLLSIAPRIAGEADAIAKLCGYLPLALRLAASVLAERADLVPVDYREKLSKEKLKLLAGSDQSVEASINLSYGLLDSETQQCWRMLAIFPDTFYADAAATVWKLEAEKARDTLGRLIQYSMLEWNDSTKRYRLHDLMRDFANGQLASHDRDQGARRHASHYLAVLRRIHGFYKKGGESLKRGLTLFDLEWGNIQAGQGWATTEAAQDDEGKKLCCDYPDWGTNVLDLRQHPRENIRWREAALAAAHQLKDNAAEGRHLGSLGIAYDQLGDHWRAIEYHNRWLDIAREIGDLQGEGRANGNLGIAYRALGDYRRAIKYHEKDLEIAREIGDQQGEGSASGNLGNAYYSLGDYERAIEYHKKWLKLARETKEWRGEGRANGSLGIAYHSLGDYERAIKYHEKHLDIAREIGDRHGEGQALANLSQAVDKSGDRQHAIEYAEVALRILEEIESPFIEEVRRRLERWRGY